jgi:hypothetical protein
MEIRFKLEKETKGALRYQEVDDKGEVIEQAWAKIGTLYMRKSAFEPGASFRRCYVLPLILLEFQKLKMFRQYRAASVLGIDIDPRLVRMQNRN